MPGGQMMVQGGPMFAGQARTMAGGPPANANMYQPVPGAPQAGTAGGIRPIPGQPGQQGATVAIPGKGAGVAPPAGGAPTGGAAPTSAVPPAPAPFVPKARGSSAIRIVDPDTDKEIDMPVVKPPPPAAAPPPSSEPAAAPCSAPAAESPAESTVVVAPSIAPPAKPTSSAVPIVAPVDVPEVASEAKLASPPVAAAPAAAVSPKMSSAPGSFASKTPVSLGGDASADDDDGDDDWETKDESELVMADSPDPSKAPPGISLRPGGATSFISATKNMAKQEAGKKCYDKEFLLQFAKLAHCQDRPAGMTLDMDIVQVDAAGNAVAKGRGGGGPDEWRTAARGGPTRGGGGAGADRFSDPRAPGNNQFQKGGKGGGKGGKGVPSRGFSNFDVKPLEESENAWKPNAKSKEEVDALEKLLRTTKGLLNKFTPEKFTKLTDQFLEVSIRTATSSRDARAPLPWPWPRSLLPRAPRALTRVLDPRAPSRHTSSRLRAAPT